MQTSIFVGIYKKVDRNKNIASDFVRLARLALAGRPQDVQLFLHRAAKKYHDQIPDLGETLASLLREAPTRASPLRRNSESPLPVDLDSRLQLLRVEQVGAAAQPPILAPNLQNQLEQLISELQNPGPLLKVGLQPTRTVLFTGPPGVGKTLTARWLANRMNKPLLVLDLAAVMSSFLGRTGNNVRYVLDYAKNVDCILLLDELDAIAKRRDDESEIGELKRLVTVLLQEIDDWPSTNLLVAATNHPNLLDPAVWRRFELVVEFSMPTSTEIEQLIESLLVDQHAAYVSEWKQILGIVLFGMSFSDIERQISLARRASVLRGEPLSSHLQTLIQHAVDRLSKADRIKISTLLVESRIVSQRQASELTGISRDTIRKAAPSKMKIVEELSNG